MDQWHNLQGGTYKEIKSTFFVSVRISVNGQNWANQLVTIEFKTGLKLNNCFKSNGCVKWGNGKLVDMSWGGSDPSKIPC